MKSDETAFPANGYSYDEHDVSPSNGICIRDYAALKILCALITNEGASSSDNSDVREADVKRAYLYADELIKQSEQ